METLPVFFPCLTELHDLSMTTAEREAIQHAPHIGANEARAARHILDTAMIYYQREWDKPKFTPEYYREQDFNLSFAAGTLYRLGVMEGKRQERARRKKGAGHE